ncbi:hypothetical protein [Methanobrevibacter millerae]|uniref:hypothetical protein n=1 Tax=Methanobrevibacter millerae TaxID=230361 RepID=UPI00122D1F22|nr:hypothetical protein [Methanobrevibacter millerae]
MKSWPPSDDIEPLLISMHFNTSFNDAKGVISTAESRDFFSSYGPVGCRDISTLTLLKELDIDSYYSGDLTLTLNGKNSKNDKKYIVVNFNESKEIIDFLKQKLICQYMIFNMDQSGLLNRNTWINVQFLID